MTKVVGKTYTRRMTLAIEVEVSMDVSEALEALLAERQERLATEDAEDVEETFYGDNICPRADKMNNEWQSMDYDLEFSAGIFVEDYFHGRGLAVEMVSAEISVEDDAELETMLADELSELI